jgi:hypothetical protein
MSIRRRRGLLGMLAAVVLIAAGLVAYARTRDRSYKPPTVFPLEGICLNCARDVHVNATTDSMPPLVCPYCAKATVYEWMYCPACKRLFAPTLTAVENGGTRQQPFPSCPVCKSRCVTAYEPGGLLDQKPDGRLFPSASQSKPATTESP